MINFDYFIESMEYFYETYPKLRHILKYPENMADIIYPGNQSPLYINTYVATSVGKFYNSDPNEGLYKILKYNEIINNKKQIYLSNPNLYRMYSTNDKFKGLVENKHFIKRFIFEYSYNENIYKTIFKINDNENAGYIVTDYNNMITDMHIIYKYRRTNLLHEMLKVSNGVIGSNRNIEDEIIKVIFNEINKNKE